MTRQRLPRERRDGAHTGIRLPRLEIGELDHEVSFERCTQRIERDIAHAHPWRVPQDRLGCRDPE